MRIPTDREIRALHAKYAPTQEAFDLVHTHCEIVCGIAEQLLARTELNLDMDLVRAGSLLHDIGVYRLYGNDGKLDHARYVRHGVLGYEILLDEGFPEAICRFCSCHTGMGISRDDVREQGLPLPSADYLAESGEEKLVMYADKFHSKTDPPTFVSAASYATRIRRFGEEKVIVFKTMCESFGLPDLVPFTALHGHAVV
ncbi:HD domain-containing protein [Streptosporangium sp. NPDC000396]|uniref:HD domain-containing protein n=1 Tax=Streptosporangium sp. NPDC000396 TaxID=3366185 RepID=UPI00369EE48D